MGTIHRTLAEQEVTARYDQEERVLWLGTSTPWVARRWQRASYAVRVVGTVGGAPVSWENQAPVDGAPPALAPRPRHGLPENGPSLSRSGG